MAEEINPDTDYSPFAVMSYTPTLHDVYKVLGKKIVGEEESRLALFTNWILARKYCILTGASRSGKTFLKDAVKDLIVGDVSEGGMCYTLKQGSTKSGWYAAEEISKSSFVDIPELNQLPLDMMEVLKTWGENKPAEYSVVEMINGRKQNRKYKLPFKPFVFAIADENSMSVPAELRYRLIEIRTDSSQSQTSRIIESQAQKEIDPFAHKTDEELTVDEGMRTHIKTLPPFEQMTYVNPLASFVAEKVPKNFTDARTAHPVFQDSIKGVQRFYWKQSMIETVNGKKALFISPQAVMENYIINGRTFLNSVMKVNDVELEMLNILKSELGMFTRKQIAKMLRARSVNIRDSIINKHLLNLEEMNYVDVSSTGQTKHYQVNADANMEGFHIKGADLMEQAKLIMESLHPEYYEDYCEMYLDRPTFIHPFTGKVVDLRSYELGSSPKTMETPSIFESKEPMQDENNGITSDVVVEEPGHDDEEEQDVEEDVIESDLDLWKREGKSMYLSDFEAKFGKDAMLTVLAEGDAFTPDTDTIQPLR